MTELLNEVCGAETPNGPCTMKAGHSVTWHRHQVYDTVEWRIFRTTGELLKTGTGRLGLQYALNDCFLVSDELVINIKDVNNA